MKSFPPMSDTCYAEQGPKFGFSCHSVQQGCLPPCCGLIREDLFNADYSSNSKLLL